MYQVLFLYNNSGYHQYYAYPVLLNRGRLQRLGYHVRFANSASEIDNTTCDCMVVDNTLFWKEGNNYLNTARQKLQEWRRKAGKIIWFDTGDSSGELEAGILEHVDLYLKAYCLKDRKLYCRSFHHNRIWADYYFKMSNADQSLPVESELLPNAIDTSKIKPGWNYFLGSFNCYARYLRKCGRCAPWMAQVTRRFVSTNRNRPLLVSMRVSSKYMVEGEEYKYVSWQREVLSEKLCRMGIVTKRIPARHYIKELSETQIAISPFGWGEICLRDFEIFHCGATLMKPSVGHLETWPNLFVPNLTYIPLDWDLGNLEEATEKYGGNRARVIAENAQKTYIRYTSEEGFEQFCKKFEEWVL